MIIICNICNTEDEHKRNIKIDKSIKIGDKVSYLIGTNYSTDTIHHGPGKVVDKRLRLNGYGHYEFLVKEEHSGETRWHSMVDRMK